jgi:hypothetical protein
VTENTSVSGLSDEIRDDDVDDGRSSHSSDDTVYESDAIVSACCTPTCDDFSAATCDGSLRRDYRSTSPPSRNMTPQSVNATPVAKEG